MTALHLACSHGNYEVMKLLVGAFADVNATTGVSPSYPCIYYIYSCNGHVYPCCYVLQIITFLWFVTHSIVYVYTYYNFLYIYIRSSVGVGVGVGVGECKVFLWASATSRRGKVGYVCMLRRDGMHTDRHINIQTELAMSSLVWVRPKT